MLNWLLIPLPSPAHTDVPVLGNVALADGPSSQFAPLLERGSPRKPRSLQSDRGIM